MSPRLALILPALCLAAAQEPLAPQGKGVIEGVVLNEVTRDPVRKAVISLGGPTTPTNVVTDQSGRFVVRSLPPGQYWIAAQHSGFGNSPTSESGRQLTLAADEEKTGVEITLMPFASISGRILDEFNAPIAGCGVSAGKAGHPAGPWRFAPMGASQATNDRGEYRISTLPPGRYYVSAQCSKELIAPHPLMALDDPRIPRQVYRVQYYPGATDPSGATRIAVTPGADIRGIDLQMHREDSFTVRGHIGIADGSSLINRPIGIHLSEDVSIMTGGSHSRVSIDSRTGAFEIRSVPAGSYVLSAGTFGDGPPYRARQRVEVGDSAPDPIDVVLSLGEDVSGTIETEQRDPKNPPQINLSSFDPFGMGTAAQAAADGDGAFVLHGVFPGRQMLSVGNVPGYIREFRIGDKQMSPLGFDLAPGTAGPWRIVMGTKGGKLSGTVTGSLPEKGTVFAVLVPPASDMMQAGAPAYPVNRDGKLEISGVMPGRYRIFALETANPYAITSEPELLKAIESRGQAVDISENDPANVTLEIITAEELRRLLREVQ